MSLSLIHSEQNWWVVDKPAGLSVHNAESSKTGEDLVGLLAKQVKVPRGELAPVHRLDQETSGLIVLCKAPITASLIAALDQNDSEKKYQAVLRGKLEAPLYTGSWDWPLSAKAEGRRNPQGQAGEQKPSKTLFKVLAQNQYFTSVELILETGRTHQIRRHAAMAKHSVVGDRRYDTEKFCELVAEKYGFNRMALHAIELKFTFQGKAYQFQSPLPEDFSKLLT